MKGLAWDDEPKFCETLKSHLEEFGISLDITHEHDDFIRLYRKQDWDFVITDLMQADSPVKGEDDPTGGVDIAKRVCDDGLPVFVITKEYGTIDRSALGIPDSAIVKSKSLNPGWMATDIRDELVRRGVYVKRKNVFLIYGHDRQADGARQKVEHFLKQRGVKIVTVSEAPMTSEIATSLIRNMNECAAIVAICTPDDHWHDGTRHPRQNVILEIGVALGLSRGLDRLIVLQKFGVEPVEQTVLPSDLGGVLTVQFIQNIDAAFDELEQRLEALGVELIIDGDEPH